MTNGSRLQQARFHQARPQDARPQQARPFTLLASALLATTALVAPPVLAQTPAPAPTTLPVGGTVVQGSARITTDAARATTTVTQSTDRAVVNWQSFSIGRDATVRFQQPSSGSVTLNRVTALDSPSAIFGNLQANGQVWLVNPAGVFFGASARVDVSGLIATTHDISDRDFMAGTNRFEATADARLGTVENEGEITVRDAGLAALVAPHVANRGVIAARLGSVALASGRTVTVDLAGNRLINFAVSGAVTERPTGRDGQPVDALVTNAGSIFADGGRVLLSANAAKGIVDRAIGMPGVIQARSVVRHADGTVELVGEGSGTVEVSGTIDVRGLDAGTKGGMVTVTGERTGLLAGARVDASGDAGGGEVRIGGDYLGGTATAARLAELGVRPARKPVRNATATYLDVDALVTADATGQGDGGQVVVWADGTTRAHGTITARGGPQGGDGGFVETSGKATLSVDKARVDVRGATTGTWLLDPGDMYIVADDVYNPANAGLGSGSIYDVNGALSEIRASDVAAALATANVTIQTQAGTGGNGDIFVQAPITRAEGNAGTTTLTLLAERNISITAPIEGHSPLNLTLNAVNAITVSGEIALDVNNFTATGASVTLDASSVYASGNVFITATGAGGITMTPGSRIEIQNGNVDLVADVMDLRGGVDPMYGDDYGDSIWADGEGGGTRFLSIRPHTLTRDIGLGTQIGSGDALDLDLDELSQPTGFAEVILGGGTGYTGTVRIGGEFSDIEQGLSLVLGNRGAGSRFEMASDFYLLRPGSDNGGLQFRGETLVQDAGSSISVGNGGLTLRTNNGLDGLQGGLFVEADALTAVLRLRALDDNHDLVLGTGTSSATQAVYDSAILSDAVGVGFARVAIGPGTTNAAVLTGTTTINVPITAPRSLEIGGGSVVIDAPVTVTNGWVYIHADSVAINQTVTVNARAVVIAPHSTSRAMTVGGEVSSTLGLTQTELNRIVGESALSLGGVVRFMENGVFTSPIGLPTGLTGSRASSLTVLGSDLAGTLTSDVYLLGGTVLLNGTLALSGTTSDLNVSASGVGGIIFQGSGAAIQSGGGNIDLSADSISMNGTAAGTGSAAGRFSVVGGTGTRALNLRPWNSDTAVGVGIDTGIGTLRLPRDVLTTPTGFAEVGVGGGTFYTGAVTIAGTVDPLPVGTLIYVGNRGAGSSLTLQSSFSIARTAADTAGLQFRGDTITQESGSTITVGNGGLGLRANSLTLATDGVVLAAGATNGGVRLRARDDSLLVYLQDTHSLSPSPSYALFDLDDLTKLAAIPFHSIGTVDTTSTGATVHVGDVTLAKPTRISGYAVVIEDLSTITTDGAALAIVTGGEGITFGNGATIDTTGGGGTDSFAIATTGFVLTQSLSIRTAKLILDVPHASTNFSGIDNEIGSIAANVQDLTLRTGGSLQVINGATYRDATGTTVTIDGIVSAHSLTLRAEEDITINATAITTNGGILLETAANTLSSPLPGRIVITGSTIASDGGEIRIGAFENYAVAAVSLLDAAGVLIANSTLDARETDPDGQFVGFGADIRISGAIKDFGTDSPITGRPSGVRIEASTILTNGEGNITIDGAFVSTRTDLNYGSITGVLFTGGGNIQIQAERGSVDILGSMADGASITFLNTGGVFIGATGGLGEVFDDETQEIVTRYSFGGVSLSAGAYNYTPGARASVAVGGSGTVHLGALGDNEPPVPIAGDNDVAIRADGIDVAGGSSLKIMGTGALTLAPTDLSRPIVVGTGTDALVIDPVWFTDGTIAAGFQSVRIGGDSYSGRILVNAPVSFNAPAFLSTSFSGSDIDGPLPGIRIFEPMTGAVHTDSDPRSVQLQAPHILFGGDATVTASGDIVLATDFLLMQGTPPPFTRFDPGDHHALVYGQYADGEGLSVQDSLYSGFGSAEIMALDSSLAGGGRLIIGRGDATSTLTFETDGLSISTINRPLGFAAQRIDVNGLVSAPGATLLFEAGDEGINVGRFGSPGAIDTRLSGSPAGSVILISGGDIYADGGIYTQLLAVDAPGQDVGLYSSMSDVREVAARADSFQLQTIGALSVVSAAYNDLRGDVQSIDGIAATSTVLSAGTLLLADARIGPSVSVSDFESQIQLDASVITFTGVTTLRAEFVRLTADTIDTSAADSVFLSGSNGTLEVQASSSNRDIHLGGTGSGLVLSATDWFGLSGSPVVHGYSTLVIGDVDASSAGHITVSTDVTLDANLTLRASSIDFLVGGSIVGRDVRLFADTIDLSQAVGFDLSGNGTLQISTYDNTRNILLGGTGTGLELPAGWFGTGGIVGDFSRVVIGMDGGGPTHLAEIKVGAPVEFATSATLGSRTIRFLSTGSVTLLPDATTPRDLTLLVQDDLIFDEDNQVVSGAGDGHTTLTVKTFFNDLNLGFGGEGVDLSAAEIADFAGFDAFAFRAVGGDLYVRGTVAIGTLAFPASAELSAGETIEIGSEATLTVAGSLALKAGTGININTSSITTDGDLTLLGHATGGTAGGIKVTDSTLSSQGGDIVFGGAFAGDSAIANVLDHTGLLIGVWLIDTEIDAGGGDIAIRGTVTATSGFVSQAVPTGIRFEGTNDILTSGAGEILIDARLDRTNDTAGRTALWQTGGITTIQTAGTGDVTVSVRGNVPGLFTLYNETGSLRINSAGGGSVLVTDTSQANTFLASEGDGIVLGGGGTHDVTLQLNNLSRQGAGGLSTAGSGTLAFAFSGDVSLRSWMFGGEGGFEAITVSALETLSMAESIFAFTASTTITGGDVDIQFADIDMLAGKSLTLHAIGGSENDGYLSVFGGSITAQDASITLTAATDIDLQSTSIVNSGDITLRARSQGSSRGHVALRGTNLSSGGGDIWIGGGSGTGADTFAIGTQSFELGEGGPYFGAGVAVIDTTIDASGFAGGGNVTLRGKARLTEPTWSMDEGGRFSSSPSGADYQAGVLVMRTPGESTSIVTGGGGNITIEGRVETNDAAFRSLAAGPIFAAGVAISDADILVGSGTLTITGIGALANSTLPLSAFGSTGVHAGILVLGSRAEATGIYATGGGSIVLEGALQTSISAMDVEAGIAFASLPLSFPDSNNFNNFNQYSYGPDPEYVLVGTGTGGSILINGSSDADRPALLVDTGARVTIVADTGTVSLRADGIGAAVLSVQGNLAVGVDPTGFVVNPSTDVTLQIDDLLFTPDNLLVSGTGTLTVKTASFGRDIVIGSGDTATALVLDPTWFGGASSPFSILDFTSVVIGQDDGEGNVTINAPTAFALSTAIYGNTISVSAPVTLGDGDGEGNFILNATDQVTITSEITLVDDYSSLSISAQTLDFAGASFVGPGFAGLNVTGTLVGRPVSDSGFSAIYENGLLVMSLAAPVDQTLYLTSASAFTDLGGGTIAYGDALVPVVVQSTFDLSLDLLGSFDTVVFLGSTISVESGVRIAVTNTGSLHFVTAGLTLDPGAILSGNKVRLSAPADTTTLVVGSGVPSFNTAVFTPSTIAALTGFNRLEIGGGSAPIIHVNEAVTLPAARTAFDAEEIIVAAPVTAMGAIEFYMSSSVTVSSGGSVTLGGANATDDFAYFYTDDLEFGVGSGGVTGRGTSQIYFQVATFGGGLGLGTGSGTLVLSQAEIDPISGFGLMSLVASGPADLDMSGSLSIPMPVSVNSFRDVRIGGALSTDGALAIFANRDIRVEFGTIDTDGGNLTLQARASDAVQGHVVLDGALLTTAGGSIRIGGGTNDGFAVSSAPFSPDGTTFGSGVIIHRSTLDAGGGDVTIRGQGDGTGHGFYQGGVTLYGATIVTTGAGTVSVFADSAGGGGIVSSLIVYGDGSSDGRKTTITGGADGGIGTDGVVISATISANAAAMAVVNGAELEIGAGPDRTIALTANKGLYIASTADRTARLALLSSADVSMIGSGWYVQGLIDVRGAVTTIQGEAMDFFQTAGGVTATGSGLVATDAAVQSVDVRSISHITIQNGATFSTSDGDLAIIANSDGGSGYVLVSNAIVSSSGTGSITIGGGAAADGFVSGVTSVTIGAQTYSGAVVLRGATLAGTDGTIAIAGRTEGVGAGVVLLDGTAITTTGTGGAILIDGQSVAGSNGGGMAAAIGTIVVEALGGADVELRFGSAEASRAGFYIGSGIDATTLRVNAVGGHAALIGTSTVQSNINMDSLAALKIGVDAVGGTSAAHVTIATNSLFVTASSVIAGTGSLSLRNVAESGNIDIGSGILSSDLFSDGRIRDGFQKIVVGGDDVTGDITISTALTVFDPLELRTGGRIIVNADLSSSGNRVALLAGASGITFAGVTIDTGAFGTLVLKTPDAVTSTGTTRFVTGLLAADVGSGLVFTNTANQIGSVALHQSGAAAVSIRSSLDLEVVNADDFEPISGITTNGALSLVSDGGITVWNANITTDGDLTLNAGATGLNGAVRLLGATITTNDGNILIGGGVGAAGPAVGSDPFDGFVAGVMLSDASLNAGAGSITIRGQADPVSDAIHTGGVLFFGINDIRNTGTAGITVSGIITQPHGGARSGVLVYNGATTIEAAGGGTVAVSFGSDTAATAGLYVLDGASLRINSVGGPVTMTGIGSVANDLGTGPFGVLRIGTDSEGFANASSVVIHAGSLAIPSADSAIGATGLVSITTDFGTDLGARVSGGSISIQAGLDITVGDTLAATAPGGGINLLAGRDVNLDGVSVITDGGDVVLRARVGNGETGAVWMGDGTTVETLGGDITIGGGGDGFAVGSSTAGVHLQDSQIDAGGGDITIRGRIAGDPGEDLRAGVLIANTNVVTDGEGSVLIDGQYRSDVGGGTWAGVIFDQGPGQQGSVSGGTGGVTVRGSNLNGAAIYTHSGTTYLAAAGGPLVVEAQGVDPNVGILMTGAGSFLGMGLADPLAPLAQSTDNVTIYADRIDNLFTGAGAFAGTGILAFETSSANRPIVVGSGADALVLDPSWFSGSGSSRVARDGFAGIVIGDATTSLISVAASVLATDPLTLRGVQILVDNDVTLSVVGGGVTLLAGASGITFAGATTVNADALALSTPGLVTGRPDLAVDLLAIDAPNADVVFDAEANTVGSVAAETASLALYSSTPLTVGSADRSVLGLGSGFLSGVTANDGSVALETAGLLLTSKGVEIVASTGITLTGGTVNLGATVSLLGPGTITVEAAGGLVLDDTVVEASAGSVTIVAGTLSVLDTPTVSGSGMLRIRSVGSGIAFGAGQGLVLAPAWFSGANPVFAPGFAGIEIGDADTTASITVAAPVTFMDPITLGAGQITLNALLTATDGNTTLEASDPDGIVLASGGGIFVPAGTVLALSADTIVRTGGTGIAIDADGPASLVVTGFSGQSAQVDTAFYAAVSSDFTGFGSMVLAGSQTLALTGNTLDIGAWAQDVDLLLASTYNLQSTGTGTLRLRGRTITQADGATIGFGPATLEFHARSLILEGPAGSISGSGVIRLLTYDAGAEILIGSGTGDSDRTVLDPAIFTRLSAGGGIVVGSTTGGRVSLDDATTLVTGTSRLAFLAGDGGIVLGAQSAIDATGMVVLKTTGDIVAMSGAQISVGTLVFDAPDVDIAFLNPSNEIGGVAANLHALALKTGVSLAVLTADVSGLWSGAGTIAGITTDGTGVRLVSGGAITITAPITTDGGDLQVSGSAVHLNAGTAIDTDGATVVLATTGALTAANAATIRTGLLIVDAPDADVVLTNAANAIGDIAARAASVAVTTGNALDVVTATYLNAVGTAVTVDGVTATEGSLALTAPSIAIDVAPVQSADDLTLTGAVTTARSLSAPSDLTVSGALRVTADATLSADGSLSLGATTLADGVDLLLAADGPVTLGSVAGTAGGEQEVLVIEANGAVVVSGAVGTDVATLDVSGAGGSFGSITVGTLVLAGTGGTFTVGPLSATTLTTQSGAYGLSLTGGGTVTNAVTFANTGALSIGGNVVFSGGMTAATPSAVTLRGTVAALNGAAIAITAPVTLAAATTLTTGTGGGSITLGSVAGQGIGLTLSTTGAVALDGTIGAQTSPIGTLTIRAGSITQASGLTAWVGNADVVSSGTVVWSDTSLRASDTIFVSGANIFGRLVAGDTLFIEATNTFNGTASAVVLDILASTILGSIQATSDAFLDATDLIGASLAGGSFILTAPVVSIPSMSVASINIFDAASTSLVGTTGAASIASAVLTGQFNVSGAMVLDVSRATIGGTFTGPITVNTTAVQLNGITVPAIGTYAGFSAILQAVTAQEEATRQALAAAEAAAAAANQATTTTSVVTVVQTTTPTTGASSSTTTTSTTTAAPAALVVEARPATAVQVPVEITTAAFQQGAAQVNDVIASTGSLANAITTMNTQLGFSNVQQRAVLDSIPAAQIITALANSNTPTAQAVAALAPAILTGQVGYAEVKRQLEAQGADQAEARSYLSVFQRLKKEGRTEQFAGAINELKANAEVNSVFGRASDAPLAIVSTEARPAPRADGTVTVGGQLNDGSRFVTMRVNGRWVFVDDQGRYEANMRPLAGTNVVVISVSDDRGQRVDRTVTVDTPPNSRSDAPGIGPARLPLRLTQEQADRLDARALADQLAQAPESATRPGRRIALMFALQNYNDDGVPDLGTPHSDAVLVSAALRERLGFETRVVRDATREQMLDQLRALGRELIEEDQVVVYFAGHGYSFSGTDLAFWLPVDAEITRANAWISSADISRLLHRMPARQILLVADSCYSGSFAGAGLSGVSDDVMRAMTGRAVMAITAGGDEPVADGTVNSPFAESLNRQIRQLSDATPMSRIFEAVLTEVSLETPQTPNYGIVEFAGYDDGADYVVVPLGATLPGQGQTVSERPAPVLAPRPHAAFGDQDRRTLAALRTRELDAAD
jgi:filamentous hemagglutinin family protein